MRRQASVWAVGYAASKSWLFREAQGFSKPEGERRIAAVWMGEEGMLPGGVDDRGTRKRTTQ